MAQQITVTLTDEEAGHLRELADHWAVTLEEALRRAATDGIDMALQIKHHDEDEAAGTPRPDRGTRRATNELDDDIPL